MHRSWIALLWLLAVAPAAAQSAPLPLQLVWTAAAGCPSAADVRAELARIARVRPGYSLRPLAAEAHVTRAAGGFRVVLHTEHEGRRGERTLQASDCATLARSVTLVLALAFGPAVELASEPVPPSAAASIGHKPSTQPQRPTSVAEPGIEAREPGSPTGSDRAPAMRQPTPLRSREGAPSAPRDRPARETLTPAAREPEPSAARETVLPVARAPALRTPEPLVREAASTRTSADDHTSSDEGASSRARDGDEAADGLGVMLIAKGWGSIGLLPRAALGGGAGVRLKLGQYALEARAALVPSSSVQLASGIRADFHALGGSVLGCELVPLAEVFELAACAGGRVMAITGRASGALAPEQATAPWMALTALGSVAWPRRSWLQLRLELSLAVSLSRPRFIVESLGDVHHVAMFVPELGLGLMIGL